MQLMYVTFGPSALPSLRQGNHFFPITLCALQSRGAAARAKEELNGVLLHQQELKLGWGKAVAMPSTPLFAGTASAHAPVKGERQERLLIHAASRTSGAVWLLWS